MAKFLIEINDFKKLEISLFFLKFLLKAIQVTSKKQSNLWKWATDTHFSAVRLMFFDREMMIFFKNFTGTGQWCTCTACSHCRNTTCTKEKLHAPVHACTG